VKDAVLGVKIIVAEAEGVSTTLVVGGTLMLTVQVVSAVPHTSVGYAPTVNAFALIVIEAVFPLARCINKASVPDNAYVIVCAPVVDPVIVNERVPAEVNAIDEGENVNPAQVVEQVGVK
jgi:hypothetical protein